MTAIDINKKLDTFENLIETYGTNGLLSKEMWQRSNEIAENFKAAQFEEATDKEAALLRFQNLQTALKDKEKAMELECMAFSEAGEHLIQEFETAFKTQTTGVAAEAIDFAVLRKQGNEIFEYFKVQKWISKERRTTAWDRYSQIRTAIKDIEDQLYNKLRDEKTKQTAQSLEIAEKLCVVIDACHPDVAIEQLVGMVQKFDAFLTENGIEKPAKPWLLIEKPEEARLSLKARTESLNDIRNFVTNNRDMLTREHKGQVFATLDTIKQDLNKAWEAHKEEQAKRQQEWEEKKKERDARKIDWRRKQLDFLDMLEKRLLNQRAFKEKQLGYLKTQEENKVRMEKRIPQQLEYLDRLEDQLEDLDKKYKTAWTDTFKDKVQIWIDEKVKKKNDVLKDIEVIKGKIVDIDKTNEDLKKRIEELEKSIEDIASKAEEVKEKLANDTYIIEPTAEATEEVQIEQERVEEEAVATEMEEEAAIEEVKAAMEADNVAEAEEKVAQEAEKEVIEAVKVEIEAEKEVIAQENAVIEAEKVAIIEAKQEEVVEIEAKRIHVILPTVNEAVQMQTERYAHLTSEEKAVIEAAGDEINRE